MKNDDIQWGSKKDSPYKNHQHYQPMTYKDDTYSHRNDKYTRNVGYSFSSTSQPYFVHLYWEHLAPLGWKILNEREIVLSCNICETIFIVKDVTSFSDAYAIKKLPTTLINIIKTHNEECEDTNE